MKCLCKICGNIENRNFYASNKSRCKVCCQSAARHRRKMMTPFQRTLSNMTKRHNANSWKNIFKNRCASARKRESAKLGFDITPEFLKDLYDRQGGKCYYTGWKLSNRGNKETSLSIDRLDNKRGYLKGNVVLACTRVNLMKHTLGQAEFFQITKAITRNWAGKHVFS